MRFDTRRRRAMQRVKSAVKRLIGRAQPTLAEIAAAETRVAAGTAGSCDAGDPARDHCLARGYCCETGCRACPWGYRRRR